MGSVYHQLVASLELYDTPALALEMTHTESINGNEISEILDYSLTGLGEKTSDEKEKNGLPSPHNDNSDSPMVKKTLLEVADSKCKISSRRVPRKSALKSRRFISRITSKEHAEEEGEDYHLFNVNSLDENTSDKMEGFECEGRLDEFGGKENVGNVLAEDSEALLRKYQDTLDGDLVKDGDNALVRGKKSRGKKRRVDKGKSVTQCEFSQCTYVAKNKSQLQNHMRKMHKGSPSSCDVCNKVFPNKGYMMKHKASHKGPQHCCDVCGKMYKIKRAMTEHRKTHESSYQKPSFKCNQCAKTFCNQYILDCHVRDVHRGLKKSFLCSVCGKSFTTKHSLMEHSNAHNGLKPYACNICDKTFSYETALRDHKFCHLDSKQFWCRHCQKPFSQRSGLRMHMRTHRLDKMFTCSECGRGFTQKQALQRHERVHKGEKPFICRHCGRFFTDASIIRRHLILVHKIEKARDVWREDIVCTIVADSDHHVQKVSDEDNLSKIEIQKEEVLNSVGLKCTPESLRKGPSKAFQRYYPRRVAIVDEADNVIAGPEIIIQSSLPCSEMSTSISPSVVCSSGSLLQFKSISTQSPTTTTLIEVSEAGVEIDAVPQVLSGQFMDQNQWDLFTSQLKKASSTTHLEHIIMEGSNQQDVSKSLEQTHKLIKCESLPHAVSVETDGQSEECQVAPNPALSPMTFNPVVLSGSSKSGDNPFESLTAHLNPTSGQYFDMRVSNHSTPVPWPSVCYYPHLVTQLGINISQGDVSFQGQACSSSSSSYAPATATVLPSNGLDVSHTSTAGLIVDSGAIHDIVSDVSAAQSSTGVPSTNQTQSIIVSSSTSTHHKNLPDLLGSVSQNQSSGDRMAMGSSAVSESQEAVEGYVLTTPGLPGMSHLHSSGDDALPGT